MIGDEFWSGAVYLVSGVTGGSAPVTATAIDQDTSGVPGTSESSDGFGTSLAAGDVTGDGRADLAVGVPADWLGDAYQIGSVTLLRGSAGGLTTGGFCGVRITADTAGIAGVPRVGSGFGVAVTAARVQGRGPANLIIGSASALTSSRFGGLVNQLGRADSGPQPASSRVFGQHSRGVRGTAADGDAFGWSLA